MKNYFKVNEEQLTKETNNIEWLAKSRPLSLRPCATLLYGTFINYFICKRKKRFRTKRLFEKSNSKLKASLDVRTLLRMQSLLLSHIKVSYEPRHHSMLKLQRNARTIIETESNENDSEG